MEFELADLFGVGASQTLTTLTINKAGLAGLSPSATNSAESIIAGLVAQLINECYGFLVDENGDQLVDEVGDLLVYDHIQATNRLSGFEWKNTVGQGWIIHRHVLMFKTHPSNMGFNPNYYA